ncbi:MAG: MarR family transcriptional regulator [Clostridia bacterium]|nr:MarR family transcriptional regulator [Clostridia bacterium]
MEQPFDPLRLEAQLCFPLYAASREVIKQYYPFLEQLDLTYTQYVTMMVVWEEKRLTAGALGKRLFLDSGTLTPVLKALEKKGYLTRTRSKEDERVLLVELTEAGEALKAKAAEVPHKVGACIPLDPDDAKELYRLLYTLLDRLR